MQWDESNNVLLRPKMVVQSLNLLAIIITINSVWQQSYGVFFFSS